MKKSNAGSTSDSILIVAAEASSCMYARRFISEWKTLHPQFTFYGVGDKRMQKEGMDCIGLAEEMAVVGLQEVISHWDVIKSCADGILERVQNEKPKFALLLDYPGFNLRLAKKLKNMGIPVVYYISPQLWAWKKGRVKQVKDYVDDMMVVFPFEVDFYKDYGIDAHFVGHPLVEVVDEELDKYEAPKSDKTLLGLMPGSRKSEIKYNLVSQLQAAKLINEKHDVIVKILLAPTLEKSDLETYMDPDSKLKIEFIQGPPTQMIQQCDYILTASGTATLQVALCGKPMVVMYRMNSITAFLAKLLVRSVDAFCIVNLIAGRKIVPELFQGEADGKGLAKSMLKLIEDKAERERMLQDLYHVKEKLGKGGATDNLVQYLNRKYMS